MTKKKGIIAVTFLITMLLILVVATMGLTSIDGLKKLRQNSTIRENYLIGENFVTYYQIFVTEKIKEQYLNLPFEEEYQDEKEDINMMNLKLLNECYGALTVNWNKDFKQAMQYENTKSFLKYELYKLNVTKEYYFPQEGEYKIYRGEVSNSDFRVKINMILKDEAGFQKHLNTVIYLYIPSYKEEDKIHWNKGEELLLDKSIFNENKLTKVGDTVVFD